MHQGFAPSSHSAFFSRKRHRTGGAGKTIVIVLGVLGVVAVLCCGGFALMGYLGFSKAGMAVIEPIKSNPELIANLGEIKSASINFQDTVKVQQEEPGEDQLVVDVTGTKGKGQLIIVPDKAGGNGLKSARLRLPDGKDIPLISAELDVSAPR